VSWAATAAKETETETEMEMEKEWLSCGLKLRKHI